MARCQRDYDPTIGRLTAPDPAKYRRGDGDLYDYCMDDPVSRVDPTGLWSKTNFDESKVRRDNLGKFAPTGAAGGKSSISGGGDLYAAAPFQTATDASSHWSPPSKAQEHELIGRAFGENAMGLYKEIQTLEEARKNAATEREKTILNDKIDNTRKKLYAMLDYKVVFSEEFRKEQELIARGWKAKITTEKMSKEFLARMAEIEAAPPGRRAELVKAFYTRLAEAAGMPQLRIETGTFERYGGFGPMVGGHSDGQKVTMNMKVYDRDPIDWEIEIANFFHEQGHGWKDEMLRGNAATACPKDLERLRHSQQNYVDVRVSRDMYEKNPLELHAREFELTGLGIFGEWEKHR